MKPRDTIDIPPLVGAGLGRVQREMLLAAPGRHVIVAGMSGPHPAQSLFTLLLSMREQNQQDYIDAEMQFLSFCARNHLGSQAQFFQDLFVLYLLGPKRQGYFVEFGATDGMELSNSLLLERAFDWRGILAEPATCWHQALRKNRRAKIDQRCVWSHTGEQLMFNETPQAMLSTIDQFSDRDYASATRVGGKKYMVETVSLNDLLAQHDCPSHIDYMSIDTEGSELSILSNFDFAKYDVGIMSVEHNNVDPDRRKIFGLLRRNGFARVFERFSAVDDWYVKHALLDASGNPRPPARA